MNLFTFYLVVSYQATMLKVSHIFPLKRELLLTSTVVHKHPQNILDLGIKGVLSFVKKCRERQEVLCKLEVILTTRISTKYCVVYICSILQETLLKFVLFYLHVTHKHNNTFLFMTYLMLFLVNVQILKHQSEYRTSS